MLDHIKHRSHDGVDSNCHLAKNFDSIVSAVEATMKVSEMPEIVDIHAVTQSPDLSGDLQLEPILKLCTKQGDPLPRFIRGYLKITELIYVFNQLRQKLGEENRD